MKVAKHIAHVVYAFIAIHLSVVASDRMKDAYADVAMDKVATFTMHMAHLGEDAAK